MATVTWGRGVYNKGEGIRGSTRGWGGGGSAPMRVWERMPRSTGGLPRVHSVIGRGGERVGEPGPPWPTFVPGDNKNPDMRATRLDKTWLVYIEKGVAGLESICGCWRTWDKGWLET